MKVTRQRGALGQFDVLVDGELIASRGASWPDPNAVVARIETLLAKWRRG